MDWEFERVAGPYEGVTEGPAWDGTALFFSLRASIGDETPELNRIMRYDPVTGETTVYRSDTKGANGLAFDREGRLFGCAAHAHGVVRYDPDGTMEHLPNVMDGKRNNRPNDLVVDSQGRIWFSDPFGRASTPEERAQGLDHTSVNRLDPRPDGGYDLRRMTHDTRKPNGVLLSKDERTLYVAVGYDEDLTRELRAYPIRDDDTLGPHRVIHAFGRDEVDEAEHERIRREQPAFYASYGEKALGNHRGVDGMCLDDAGNIIACAGWKHWGPGPMVYVFSPEGRVLSTHPHEAGPINCTWGGADLGILYITMGKGLFRVTNTGRRGWLLYPQQPPVDAPTSAR